MLVAIASRIPSSHPRARGAQRAAKNLVQYLHHQVQSTGEAPSDRTIVVESFLAEIGDWRIALLSPFGAGVHAPWAMAVTARLREQTGDEVDMIWTDDGRLFRVADGQDLPSLDFLFPSSDEIESIVVQQLGATALFAGRFRENAARALLWLKKFCSVPGEGTGS